jgi:hypothetical protein
MATGIPGSVRWPAERRFYTGITIAIFLTVYVGFARSFFLRPLFPGWPSPHETIFYVHGALFSAWCCLFIAQASLVTARRADLHRKFGAWGAGLAAGMVVIGIWGALIAAARPTGFVGVPVPRLQFLIIPLFDMALFATFVTLAVVRRRDAQAHKRLMVLATVNLLGAAIARWPGMSGGPLVFYAFADLFVLALAVWDFRSRGRLHPVTLWGGLVIVLSQPLRLVISGTPAWGEFARWATGLVA